MDGFYSTYFSFPCYYSTLRFLFQASGSISAQTEQNQAFGSDEEESLQSRNVIPLLTTNSGTREALKPYKCSHGGKNLLSKLKLG
jgi:hypothetical protein